MEVVINEGETIDSITDRLSAAFQMFVEDPNPIYIPTLLYYIPEDDIRQTTFVNLKQMAEHCQRIFDLGIDHYRQIAVSFSSIPFCNLATMYFGDGSVIEVPELLNMPTVGEA